MDGVGSYLLSVTGAVLLCGLADRFLGKNGVAATAKLITGVFLTLTVLHPLASADGQFWKQLSIDVSDRAEEAVAQGEILSRNAMAQIIKEETAAYILEKAKTFDADIQVQVELSQEQIPKPVGVRITGAVAPYAKTQLQAMIEEQLGISKENQRWT